jgi:hypothetical protein
MAITPDTALSGKAVALVREHAGVIDSRSDSAYQRAMLAPV